LEIGPSHPRARRGDRRRGLHQGEGNAGMEGRYGRDGAPRSRPRSSLFSREKRTAPSALPPTNSMPWTAAERLFCRPWVDAARRECSSPQKHRSGALLKRERNESQRKAEWRVQCPPPERIPWSTTAGSNLIDDGDMTRIPEKTVAANAPSSDLR
jgi:hypothetical protein